MGETSVHGATRRESSGGPPDGAKRNRPPPPPLGPRDHISALPDAVIHHIFSFLPLRDVVKTCALSKRWLSTWTTTTHLVFHGLELARSSQFSSLVDSVLIRCASPTVKRFHITQFICNKADRPKLDLWLRFAEARRVEDLHLWLISRRSKFFYVLPRFLYCLRWLVRLEVCSCCFPLGTSTTVRWPCLKVLLIKDSELSEEILEGIFRGSPVLESLELNYSKGVRNIVIDSTSVKELVLVQRFSSRTEKLWAPHLRSLRASGYWMHHSMLRLDGISSLVEAELDFVVCGDKRMRCGLFKELFEELRGVRTITIGPKCSWCLQILSLLEMEGVPSPLSKCHNLILRAPISQWNLPGIAYMLQSSRCLEKLVIDLTAFPILEIVLDEESKKRFNFDEEDFLCSRKGNFECLAKHLKRVEIIGYGADRFGSKHLLALIKFLLGDALVLEKLIIKAELPTRHEDRLQAADLSRLLGVCINVLSFQRASKNAEVIFDCPFE